MFFHVILSLIGENSLPSQENYFLIDISTASSCARDMILMILRSVTGYFGNIIFFVCSAWFLLDDDRVKGKKWFFMLFEVWIVSVTILVLSSVLLEQALDIKMVVKSLLPSTFSNCWYISCYLLFYPLHRYLNALIRNMEQRELLGCTVALAVLYLGIGFLKQDLFFQSLLIVWVATYFLVAYAKYYMAKTVSSVKANVMLMLLGIAGQISIVLATNFLGLRIELFSDKVLRWGNNSSPFLVLAAMAAFNLARRCTFHSRTINYFSSLSLLIYIIHENIILRTYCRPRALQLIYDHFGYSHVFLAVCSLAAAILLGTTLICCLYDKTVRKFVKQASDKMWMFCKKGALCLENVLMRVK